MPPTTRRPGMADVARMAGVSHQTVSRVLNAPGSVRDSTRERVEQAMRELGYRRNMGARALATSRSNIIGVIVAQGGYSGPAETSSSIQTAARDRGYATLVASLRDTTRDEVQQVLNLFLDHRVDGIVAIAPQLDLADRLAPLASQIPLVMIADGMPSAGDVHIVSVDQHAAAYLATKHLIDLGHRTIAHVRGPQTWFDAIERERGWLAALRDANLRPGPILQGDWSAESGFHAGRALLDQGLPDAVVVANDLMSLGLAAAVSQAGSSIPEDVSIVGHDDIPGSQFFHPPLTTVRQPFNLLGEACVSAVLDLISGNAVEAIHVSPTLEVRGSTAPRH